MKPGNAGKSSPPKLNSDVLLEDGRAPNTGNSDISNEDSSAGPELSGNPGREVLDIDVDFAGNFEVMTALM